MAAPTPHAARAPEPNDAALAVRLVGDAYVTITAPFYPEGDALVSAGHCMLGDGEYLDDEGLLRRCELPLHSLMKGTLTFVQPTVGELTSFVGSKRWLEGLLTGLNRLATGRACGAFDWIELRGMLFPDGYGSVAVTLRLPGGWEPDRRTATLDAVGVVGREWLAWKLRSELLPPLERMMRRSGVARTAGVELPYFNLTYAGQTYHPQPGRSVLDDELRPLVYPDSSQPLPSFSPWVDEYLYTGYAYHLLAMRDPLSNLRKLELLLLILNVSYARLARFAAAADKALLRRDRYSDVGWLASTERQLRAEYQALATPTFSFDHHALKVRDAIMTSWDVPTLQARTDNLLSSLRNAVEFRMAKEHARRVGRLNWIVVWLTVAAAIPALETVFRFLRAVVGALF